MLEINEEERVSISFALYRQNKNVQRLKEVLKGHEKGTPSYVKVEMEIAKEEGIFYGMIRMMKTFGFAIKQYKDGSTGETNYKVGIVAPFALEK